LQQRSDPLSRLMFVIVAVFSLAFQHLQSRIIKQ
jgi:hypothetical protein